MYNSLLEFVHNNRGVIVAVFLSFIWCGLIVTAAIAAHIQRKKAVKDLVATIKARGHWSITPGQTPESVWVPGTDAYPGQSMVEQKTIRISEDKLADET